MRKKFTSILMLMLLLLYGCSKFYYRPPLVTFNHEKHVDVLFEQKKDCTFCHKLPAINALLEQKGEYKPEPGRIISDLKRVCPQLEMGNKCHFCHKDEATRVIRAPKNCGICHQNMKTLKPDDHVNNWIQMHVVPASLARKECTSCHKDWFCEACHSQQKSLKSRMHSRTYKLKHSLEAMVDPGRCDTCHRVDFCIDCHLKSRS